MALGNRKEVVEDAYSTVIVGEKEVHSDVEENPAVFTNLLDPERGRNGCSAEGD